MRDTRWRKVARDMWMHRSRSALVIAAIIVGIVGAGAVLDAWSLLRRVTRDGYLATNPPSAVLRISGADSALIARVRAMPSVLAVSARRSVVASIRTPQGSRTAVLFAGSDLGGRGVARLDSVAGQWIPDDAGLSVENSSVEFAGLAVGDSVTVQLGDGAARVLPVTGIVRDAGLAPGWMEHVVYAFVTPATLEAIGAPPGFDELRIVVRGDRFDRAAIRRIALEVKAEVELAGHRVLDVDVPVPGRHIHAGQMDSLLFTLGAFGTLTLLLSAFLVVNLISAMLAGQLREIGTMKAIGAQPGQIAAMYLGLALALGALASAIALPIAAFIGRLYAEFSADLLNFDVAGYRIPLWAFAIQGTVGLVLPVVAAAFPVWRGARIPVNDALRDIGESAPRAFQQPSRPLARASRIAGGLGRPFLLSLRNAFRRRQRMTLTLVTLSLGGAVYLGALGLRASIRRSVGVLYEEILRFDISIRLSDSHPADSIERVVANVEGVAAVEAWGGMRAAVDAADGMLAPSFPVTALPRHTRLVRFPVLEGRWLDTSASALVVNQRLAATDSSLRVGRTAMLVMNGKRSPWRVVGIVESGPTPNAYITREAAAAALGTASLRSAMIRATARTAAGQSELVARLRETLGTKGFDIANAGLVQAGRAGVEDHLLMVAGFLLIMSQLALIVGGLALASTMGLAVLERTREIGVLRAIGASHAAIFGLVQAEGLVIALASWLVAIPLSMPVSVLLGMAFSRIMMPVPVRFLPEADGVLLWLGLVVVLSLLATAWPARSAMRVTTAAALSYE